MSSGGADPLRRLLGRKVGDDHARRAGIDAGGGEPLPAHGEDRVDVGHERERHADLEGAEAALAATVKLGTEHEEEKAGRQRRGHGRVGEDGARVQEEVRVQRRHQGRCCGENALTEEHHHRHVDGPGQDEPGRERDGVQGSFGRPEQPNHDQDRCDQAGAQRPVVGTDVRKLNRRVEVLRGIEGLRDRGAECTRRDHAGEHLGGHGIFQVLDPLEPDRHLGIDDRVDRQRFGGRSRRVEPGDAGSPHPEPRPAGRYGGRPPEGSVREVRPPQ